MSGAPTSAPQGPTEQGEAATDPEVERWLSAFTAGNQESDPAVGYAWSGLSRDLGDERGVRAWLRSRPSPQRRAFAILAAIILPVGVLFATPRADLEAVPLQRLLLDLALFLVPAALAFMVALHPIHKPALPRWFSALGVGLALGGVVVMCSLPQAHIDHPASLLGVGDDLVPRALGCFSFGSVIALPMLLLVRGVSRGSGGWWVPTLAVAATVVLVGGLALYLHCPLTAPVHLWAGHATVWLPFLALALVAGRRASDG